MRMWLLVLAVGVLVLGASAGALAQVNQATPGDVNYKTSGVINMDKGSGKLDTHQGVGGPKMGGPTEIYGPADTSQKGWVNMDKGSGKLDTNPGTGGPKVFGPAEVHGPLDTSQKGWTNVDKK